MIWSPAKPTGSVAVPGLSYLRVRLVVTDRVTEPPLPVNVIA